MPTDMLRHANEHLPTQRSFRRMYRLGLLVDIPAAGFAVLAEAPRAASRLVLTGVPRRT